MKNLSALLILLSASSTYAQSYFCLLAQMKDSVPVKTDRKIIDLTTGAMELSLDNGFNSTIEVVTVPATDYTPASTLLAVGLSKGATQRVDALYDLEQTHTFLKLTTPEEQVSLQCYKR